MEESRSAVDRVRPVLQAMERSIDAARRRRLDTGPIRTDDPRPLIAPDHHAKFGEHPPLARLRARPKRSIPPSAFHDPGEMRSAG